MSPLPFLPYRTANPYMFITSIYPDLNIGVTGTALVIVVITCFDSALLCLAFSNRRSSIKYSCLSPLYLPTNRERNLFKTFNKKSDFSIDKDGQTSYISSFRLKHSKYLILTFMYQ